MWTSINPLEIGFSVKYAAREIGIKPAPLHKRVKRGTIDYFLVNDRVFIKDRAIEELKARKRNGSYLSWSIEPCFNVENKINATSWNGNPVFVYSKEALFIVMRCWFLNLKVKRFYLSPTPNPKKIEKDKVMEYLEGENVSIVVRPTEEGKHLGFNYHEMEKQVIETGYEGKDIITYKVKTDEKRMTFEEYEDFKKNFLEELKIYQQSKSSKNRKKKRGVPDQKPL